MLVDTSAEEWNIVFANEAWEQLLGKKRQAELGFWDVFQVSRSAGL